MLIALTIIVTFAAFLWLAITLERREGERVAMSARIDARMREAERRAWQICERGW